MARTGGPAGVEGQFDWGSPEIPVDRRLTLEKDEVLRVMLLDKQVTTTVSHYKKRQDGGADVFRCARLDKKRCAHCEEGDTPQQRFGANVLVYRATQPTLVWEIVPWLFGKDKWKRLKKLQAQLERQKRSLRTVDLRLKCYNETFQNMHIDAFDGKPLIATIKGLRDELVEAWKTDRFDILALMTGAQSDEAPEKVRIAESGKKPPAGKPAAKKPAARKPPGTGKAGAKAEEEATAPSPPPEGEEEPPVPVEDEEPGDLEAAGAAAEAAAGEPEEAEEPTGEESGLDLEAPKGGEEEDGEDKELQSLVDDALGLG